MTNSGSDLPAAIDTMTCPPSPSLMQYGDHRSAARQCGAESHAWSTKKIAVVRYMIGTPSQGCTIRGFPRLSVPDSSAGSSKLPPGIGVESHFFHRNPLKAGLAE